MKPTNSAEIRQSFLEFFEEFRHQVVPSSPLPVYDNPTLLFANAGMVQFADTFLGKEKRSYDRAVSSQKCMRVQGKHNDLENVGPSPRHHTFFEMLGNFSFGDYFKEGAILFAFNFLTKVCEIPVDRLWYTVHKDDDAAFKIWVEDIGVQADRVLRMGDKTNFWMMGDVGPCGPTSEIHYDWGAEHCTCNEDNCSVLLDNDCGRWLEIWNLVFMQFNQDDDGNRTPLPKPGVDTGMGLERLTAVIENQPVNYDTDLFIPAMDRIQALLNDSPKERQDHVTGYRVIADHGRAATFLIADGVLPGNVGRGYVLRMVIRRAARYGREIGLNNPFLAEIAQVYIDQMGTVYPEIVRHADHIKATLTQEEKRFARTLEGALAQLESALSEQHKKQSFILPGDVAFDLYATHGLPLEIAKDVVAERGFAVDEDGFQVAREAHAAASGAGAFGSYVDGDEFYDRILNDLIDSGHLDQGGVDYDPYTGSKMESEILAIVRDGERVADAKDGDFVEIVAAATPFYLEAGGEVNDTGSILFDGGSTKLEVTDLQTPVPGLILHIGEVKGGPIFTGQTGLFLVDDKRRWDIRRNHTATHILHRELRAALGNQVTQQGSLVAPDRLRFDFSHNESLDSATLQKIEASINETILANQRVTAEFMNQTEAINAGAMALFGEKYGDIVRTIKIGDSRQPYSFELCGGLHVDATGDIGLFLFTGEHAVGAGLRRVEAITGRIAYQVSRERLNLLDRLAHSLNTPVDEAASRLENILAESHFMQKELSKLRKRQTRESFTQLLKEVQLVEGISLLTGVVDVNGMDDLREMTDWFKESVGSGIVVLGSVHKDKPILVAAVTEDLVPQGFSAGDIVGKVARIVGGGGGGRPTLAQAGGTDPEKLPEAIAFVPKLVKNIQS